MRLRDLNSLVIGPLRVAMMVESAAPRKTPTQDVPMMRASLVNETSSAMTAVSSSCAPSPAWWLSGRVPFWPFGFSSGVRSELTVGPFSSSAERGALPVTEPAIVWWLLAAKDGGTVRDNNKRRAGDVFLTNGCQIEKADMIGDERLSHRM